jgi:hypothetical protein
MTASALERGPVGTALVSAGATALALTAIRLVSLLFGGLPWAALYGGNPGDSIVGFFWELFGYVLPFAIGVFLSLFLIAPVRPGMGLVTVGVRGLIASAAGAVLVFVAGTLIRLIQNGLHDFLLQTVGNILGIVVTAVVNAPLVILVLVVQHRIVRTSPSS